MGAGEKRRLIERVDQIAPSGSDTMIGRHRKDSLKGMRNRAAVEGVRRMDRPQSRKNEGVTVHSDHSFASYDGEH